jgi:hypothetical protein
LWGNSESLSAQKGAMKPPGVMCRRSVVKGGAFGADTDLDWRRVCEVTAVFAGVIEFNRLVRPLDDAERRIA